MIPPSSLFRLFPLCFFGACYDIADHNNCPQSSLCLVDTCTAAQTFVNFYFNKIDLENFSLSYLIQIDKVDVGSELFVTQV